MNYYILSLRVIFFTILLVLFYSPSGQACRWQQDSHQPNYWNCVSSYKRGLNVFDREFWGGAKQELSQIATTTQNILIAEVNNLFYLPLPTSILPEGLTLEEVNQNLRDSVNIGDLIEGINNTVEELIEEHPDQSNEDGFLDSIIPAAYMFGITVALNSARLNLTPLRLPIHLEILGGSVYFGIIIVPQLIESRVRFESNDVNEATLVNLVPARGEEREYSDEIGVPFAFHRLTYDYKFFINPTIDFVLAARGTQREVLNKDSGFKFTWSMVLGRDIWRASQVGGNGLSLSIPTRLWLLESERQRQESIETTPPTLEGMAASVTQESALSVPSMFDTEGTEISNMFENSENRGLFNRLKGLILNTPGRIIQWAERRGIETIKFAATTQHEINLAQLPSIDNFIITFRHSRHRPRRNLGQISQREVVQLIRKTRIGLYFFWESEVTTYFGELFGFGGNLVQPEFINNIISSVHDAVFGASEEDNEQPPSPPPPPAAEPEM